MGDTKLIGVAPATRGRLTRRELTTCPTSWANEQVGSKPTLQGCSQCARFTSGADRSLCRSQYRECGRVGRLTHQLRARSRLCRVRFARTYRAERLFTIVTYFRRPLLVDSPWANEQAARNRHGCSKTWSGKVRNSKTTSVTPWPVFASPVPAPWRSASIKYVRISRQVCLRGRVNLRKSTPNWTH